MQVPSSFSSSSSLDLREPLYCKTNKIHAFFFYFSNQILFLITLIVILIVIVITPITIIIHVLMY